MIKASNITISLKKERKVVENLNFILNDNDKLAIIDEEIYNEFFLIFYNGEWLCEKIVLIYHIVYLLYLKYLSYL